MRVDALACVHLKVVVADAGGARPGNEIVVDDIMAKTTAGVGNSVGGLIVVDYIVDILRICFSEGLTVVPAHPEISIVGGLGTLNVCTELLANWEGYDGVGNGDVGDFNAVDGIPLPKCNRTVVQNDTV